MLNTLDRQMIAKASRRIINIHADSRAMARARRQVAKACRACNQSKRFVIALDDRRWHDDQYLKMHAQLDAMSYAGLEPWHDKIYVEEEVH